MYSKQTNDNKGGQANSQQGQADESMIIDALDDAHVLDDDAGGTRIGDIYIPPPVPAHCSTESKGPRLIIKNIVNRNFKSYAGEVVLGPFHHSFTAIIGPNGSGKSNVIDSMLFVFGYRANKIRCKKLSTLIHNSASFPNMRMCSVAVHFEQIIDTPNSNDCVTVSNSRIIVERTAHGDNSSYYSIDGRRVQFKEVAKLLKLHNVDLDHNRFLILQGEVESISMMKPKAQNENECGMLEYLEDIVGTTRYITPLQLINQRVEQLTEERTEKHNRCKLAEREMEDLEKPFNEAVDYLRLENENTRTKNLRLQKYLSEKNKKLEEYTKEHNEVVKALKEHDEASNKLKKEREEKEDIIRKELDEFEALREQKEAIESKLEKTKSKHTQVVKTMDITNERRKANKRQITQNEKKMQDLKKIPDKNSAEIEDCVKKIEFLNKDKVKLQEVLQLNYDQLQEQTKPLIEKRERLEKELLKIDTNEAKGEHACLESQLKILRNDEIVEMRKYESLKIAYEENQNSLKEKRTQLEELANGIPEINKEISTKSNELQQLYQEEQVLQSSIKKINAELSERTANIQNQRSNNQVLNFLMGLKSEGKVPGILGRLGNLGGIDAKYDVAISTACGRLDNIVVDTVDTAQTCIEMLKRHNAGRGTFIALEKVAYLANYSHRINTPDKSARLYDLIHVEDERVLPAFYFVLRDTLVCDNLDLGTRIAYGKTRFRVVTINGEIIEQSGTMSGGGGRAIRGKMGAKVQTKTSQSSDNSQISQKAIEEMQVQVEELQSRINYGQEEQGRLEREIQQLKIQIEEHETNIKKLHITSKSLEQQLPTIFKQLEAQRKRKQETISDPAKVKDLEEKIKISQQRVKDAEEAASKIAKQIADIKNQIEEIIGTKVKSVQTKINSVENQIKKLNSNVTKLNVEITSSERDITKMEKHTENLKEDVEKSQNELKALNEQHNDFLEEEAKLGKDIEEAKKAISNAKSQSSDIQKEVNIIKKKEGDNKLKRVEIDQKFQTITSKMNDVKAQLPRWRAQLQPLKLNEIPGDSEPIEPLKTFTEEELATHTLQDLQYKESIEEEKLKNKPNLSCINEFISKRNVYLDRVKVLEDITSKRNEMRDKYEEVRKRRYTEFMDGFRVITRKLKEMYQMITQGGDAELELVDSMDPFTEGVSFSVRPPKKTWKNISNLSGGEKTLSSLALVFALHYYKPSPLYFMDEIDAALDFKNVSIVAHYIKERTKNAQFIIVSLRSNMFELCNFMVGIYKVKDCTNSLCIKNNPPTLESVPQVTSTQMTQKSHSIMVPSLVENEENAPPQSHIDEEVPPWQTNLMNIFQPSSQAVVTTIRQQKNIHRLDTNTSDLQLESTELSNALQNYVVPIIVEAGGTTSFVPQSESTVLQEDAQIGSRDHLDTDEFTITTRQQ